MLKKIPSDQINFADYKWFAGHFHFSYADYYDPQNLRFGVLKAFNDFKLPPGAGFETHPHKEMEIISYCVEGQLSHTDDIGNTTILSPGDAQYQCAGTGICHSERNDAQQDPLRFIQIFILPNRPALRPQYRSLALSESASEHGLQHIASGEYIEGVIQIAQDANIYAARLEKLNQLSFENRDRRQCYFVCIDGRVEVNKLQVDHGEALKIIGQENLTMAAVEDSHLLMVEMSIDD